MNEHLDCCKEIALHIANRWNFDSVSLDVLKTVFKAPFVNSKEDLVEWLTFDIEYMCIGLKHVKLRRMLGECNAS